MIFANQRGFAGPAKSPRAARQTRSLQTERQSRRRAQRRRKGGALVRIQAYTNSRIGGDGGVRAPRSVDALNDRLRRASNVRNDLMHRADDSGITEEVLRRLELDAFEFVDFELRKLGTPILA